MSAERPERKREETVNNNFPRIYTVGEFDRLIESDPDFSDKIAGFSTVSLSHVLKGVTPQGFTVKPWGLEGEQYTRVELNDKAFELFSKAKTYDDYKFPLGMHMNRNHGFYWAALEVYQELEPERPLETNMNMIDDIYLPLFFNVFNKSHIRTTRELLRQIDLSIKSGQIKYPSWDREIAANNINQYFKNRDDFAE
ncbi:MAG: hypothetical protein A2857_00515 [Candidatus Levybacteria bacterium RIFCSPHIGHO2_01_FULL_36_15]|nr:MAG: hypothetical protein A2857_00515 [Candidatus Levybacteria bacterium RIFCSPHIGHO2_01_FULL_36_15]OGH38920.1 MAG: hypothetical protein A2905_03730 [Candidatus Levybacteria bacterium RIFCSPLOWO2_01_FULL_36_10]